MKQIIKMICIVAILSATACAELARAQTDTSNFILRTAYLHADSTQAARRTLQYHDGLGRPVQTLHRGVAPGEDDVADLTEYDSLGRAYRNWKPVAIGSNAGRQVLVGTIASSADSFYSDTCAYTLTQYDGSPLDRVRKVTGPGQAWHAAGKGVTNHYLTNASPSGDATLRCFKFGFSLSGNTGVSFILDGIYPAGSLTVEQTEDEDGKTLWVFKDMRNLVLLERRLAEAAAGTSPAVYADTYYLYDDAGRLTAVLPPELSAYFAEGNWSGSTDADPKVEGYAYQYRYDARGRMIAKKLPGAAWTWYVYDRGDRLVLTQDGNQRARGEWRFRLQDILGRECVTGITSGSYNAFASPLDTAQVLAIRVRSGGPYGDDHGYTVTGFSLPPDAEILTVNWWDDYTFLGRDEDLPGTAYGYTAPQDTLHYGRRYGQEAPGLQTGHWSKTLGEMPDGWDESAVRETWYYDDHGREVFHVKGYPSGKRMTEHSGYDFVGNLTALQRTMIFSGEAQNTEEYTYTYDGWGRPLETTHTLNGNTPITLSSNSYDAVGRLGSTERGDIAILSGLSALASAYSYNVRDWLTGINGTLFTEMLTYETPRTGSAQPGQWSGNISSSKWRIDAMTTNASWYDYDYDLLGRLTDAEYGSDFSSQRDYSRTYTYDLNGNMKKRNSMEGAIFHYGTPLEWTWAPGDGNRPLEWTQDRTPAQMPPHPLPSEYARETYAYDAAGNRTAVMDAQGDTLTLMRYNFMNLPEEFMTVSGDTIRYVYSADGEKLYVDEKLLSGAEKGTEYAANYRIENNVLTMIHTDAGYYTPVTPPAGVTGPVYAHLWYLQDHLGNIRVLADEGGNAVAMHDYDPFGEEIALASTNTPYPFPSGGTESPYKYGGKEWNATTSTYDFEARQLSPSSHRFTSMDPLCEKYYGISPYAYCANNPVNLVDLDGKIWENPEEAERLKQRTQNRISDLHTQIGHYSKQMSYFDPESKDYQNLQLLLNNAQKEVSLLNQSLLDIHWLGLDKDHTYTLLNEDSNGAHYVKQLTGGIIGIQATSDAMALHEIRHVGQSLDAGGLKFIFTNGNYLLSNAAGSGVGYKQPSLWYEAVAHNEIEAYQTQFAMDHSFPGQSVLFVSDINVHTVGAIHHPDGTPVYGIIKKLSDHLLRIAQFSNTHP